MRRLAIGDIHGCFRALETLAEFVALQHEDRIVTLGDYVNRGPGSRDVLQWLIEWKDAGQLVALRGNHDVMMCEARYGDTSWQRFCRYGGDATMRSYELKPQQSQLDEIPESHWRLLDQRLKNVYEDDTHCYVHANLEPELPLTHQPSATTIWKKLDDSQTPHQSGKTMICGHTAQKSGRPRRFPGGVCIDTWVYGEGWLSCLDVESGEIWQANEKGRTRRLHLDELDPP